MPFFELPIADDTEPGPRPQPRTKLTAEQRWANQLESTPRQQFVGKIGEFVTKAISMKARYPLLAGLVILGGTVIYTEHQLAQQQPPIHIEYTPSQPDACIASLPPGLASQDPAQAMVMVQQCRLDGTMGQVFNNGGTASSSQQRPDAPQS